jgi:hypothetical protein
MKYGPNELRKLMQDLGDDQTEAVHEIVAKTEPGRNSMVDSLNLNSVYQLVITRIQSLHDSLKERGYGK